MQLLMRRRILWTTFGIRFCLWAKFDVTPQELALVLKYRASEGYITIEATGRDAWRGAVLGFLAAYLCR